MFTIALLFTKFSFGRFVLLLSPVLHDMCSKAASGCVMKNSRLSQLCMYDSVHLVQWFGCLFLSLRMAAILQNGSLDKNILCFFLNLTCL